MAVLFLLLLALAGSRLDLILKIQYRHIQIVLHQPKEGALRLGIYLALEYTKTYKGRKDMKTFIIPEVLYDPTLFPSPHVFLLAILFHHRIFRNERLNNNPSLLVRLQVPHKERQRIPLPCDRYNTYGLYSLGQAYASVYDRKQPQRVW